MNFDHYSSLLDRTKERFRWITYENFMLFAAICNFFTNVTLFALLVGVEEEVKPSYKDIKEELPQLKQVILDLNEIMPEIKNSFTMLNNLCNSIEYKHLCQLPTE